MDQIQELDGPAEQNELRIKLGGVENELETANLIIEDHKRHLRDANEKIKNIGTDLNDAQQMLGTAQTKLNAAEVALTDAEAMHKLEMTNAEAMHKLEMTNKEATLKLEMTNKEATLKLEMTNAEAKWKLEMAQAKAKWDDEMTKAKGSWDADKERLEKALEKMDVSLAAKNMDGFSWLLFLAKFALEAVLAGLEFHANKDTGMKFLIPAIIIAFLALLFNGWEVFRSCKEKNVLDHKMHWSRVPWFPEIYSFFIILMEFGFYLLKLHVSKPVHVSPYTCMLHMCILVQKLILRQKLKAAGARRVIV